MTEYQEQNEVDIEDGLDLIVPGYKNRAKDLFKIDEELKKESDRGCALIAAAYLENEIYELLERFFIKQSSKAKKTLFDFNGPIGTFSSKIEISFALGLISSEIKTALSLVRKIRNEFAHLHEPLDFESNKIKQQIVALLPSIETTALTARQNFILKIQTIAATIHLYISNVQRRRVPECNLVPICEDPCEQELVVAARRLMAITCPAITYEQALDLAIKYREIRA